MNINIELEIVEYFSSGYSFPMGRDIIGILMDIKTILEFVGAIALLIIVHELGHLVAAKLLKIDVEEFGVGYPPRIATLFTAGGTKYTFNLFFFFGGFCRFRDSNDPTDEGSITSAKPWKRITVLLAGPMMNMLVAVIFYAIIISMIGMPQLDRVEIKQVAPNSPAETAGLQAGDIVVMMNEIEIDSMEKLSDVVAANLGKEVSVVFERESQEYTVTLVPRQDPPEGQGAIGIVMGNPVKQVSVVSTIPSGAVATYEHSKALLRFVGQLISGNANSEEARLVGIKGMYDMYSSARDSEPVEGIPSAVNALGFFTSITISLGLLNLLPVPALDGGRILFTLPELIFRKRIPPKYENWVHLIGYALLLLLLVYINLQDFINPVSVP